MKQSNNETMKKGFTMMEVIAAIFLITVGMGGAFALITRVISYTTISSSKLVATYLAQEGIEIVRNIRDTNWLQQQYEDPTIPWDEGLPQGNWEADYNTQNLNDDYDGDYLNIDADGFYSYSDGTPTKFKRKIKIFDIEDFDGDGVTDRMKVSVEVSWQERGRTHEVTAQENLYNWRQ